MLENEARGRDQKLDVPLGGKMEQLSDKRAKISDFLYSHLLSVLREEGLPEDVEIQVSRDSMQGEHFISVTHKVVASWQVAEGIKNKLYLFVKNIPKTEAWKNTFRSEFIFKKEIVFYDEIVPAFINFQRKYWTPLKGDPAEVGLDIFPKCFRASRNDADDFVILEDLEERGFKTVDRIVGLDYEKTMLAVRSLGRFHALSYAMKEREHSTFQSIKSLATESVFLDSNSAQFDAVFQKNAEAALKQIKGKIPEAATERLASWLKAGVYKQMIRLAQKKDEFAVINHGDCWINNILFRSQASMPLELRFIDFQVIRYASPAMDLAYLIFTSTQQQVRENHFDALLKEYHSSMLQWLARYGCVNYHNIMSFKNLEEKMSKFAMYGLAQALIFVPLYHTCSHVDELETSEDEIVGDVMSFHSEELRKEEVANKLASMVRQCYQRGYL